MLNFNRCVYVDNECHQNVNNDVSRHKHKREEEKGANDPVIYYKVELIPNKLPIIKQLHGK